MPSTVVTHLLDADGDRLCNLDGPVVSAPALLQDAGDLAFCPICARMVLVSIVQDIHTRCGVDRGADEHKETDAHLLLQIILSLTMTPPDFEAAVVRIMGTVLVELEGYVDEAGGDHA